MRAWLIQAIETGRLLSLPDSAHSAFLASAEIEKGVLRMSVHHGGAPVLVLAVVERSRQAAPTWSKLLETYRDRIGPDLARPLAPWVASIELAKPSLLGPLAGLDTAAAWAYLLRPGR